MLCTQKSMQTTDNSYKWQEECTEQATCYDANLYHPVPQATSNSKVHCQMTDSIFLCSEKEITTKEYIICGPAIGFPKVAAFGTGMAVFVLVVACRLAASKPMYHDFFTTFGAVIIPSAAKKNIICHQTMDFTITGSLWHRVVEVGIG